MKKNITVCDMCGFHEETATGWIDVKLDIKTPNVKFDELDFCCKSCFFQFLKSHLDDSINVYPKDTNIMMKEQDELRKMKEIEREKERMEAIKDIEKRSSYIEPPQEPVKKRGFW